jgi:pyruvate formate lyase activating enzyme
MIFDIKKFAIHDGPGIRTTVFFKGCPLDCQWCHNPECKSDNADLYAGLDNDELFRKVFKEIRKDLIFYDQSGGGVTFSGGEPLMQMDLLSELLVASREAGIHTAVDTCGYAKFDNFQRILDRVDLFLYDIKLIDDAAHKKYTDASNDLILDNLRELAKTGKEIRIRVPLIPGITDSDENLTGIARLIQALDNVSTVDLLPYNLFGKSKYRKLEKSHPLDDLQVQSDNELKRMTEIFSSSGLVVTA